MSNPTPRARKLASAARAAGDDVLPPERAQALLEGSVRAHDNPTAYRGAVDVLAVDRQAWTATVRFAPTAAPTTVDVEDLYVLGQPGHDVPRASPVPRWGQEMWRHVDVVLDACPVEIYTSSISPRWPWPWKLMSSHEARPGVRESCESLVIDSGVRSYAPPEDVLDKAAHVGAEYVFASDVTGQETSGDPPESNWQSIRASLELAARRDVLDRMIVPLQQPYGAALDQLRDAGWLDAVAGVAVGGLLDVADPSERVALLEAVREDVGPDRWLHALGVGTEPEIRAAIRERPGLVDAVDVSTPETAPSKGKVPDRSWSQHKHLFPSGDESSTIRAAWSWAIALMLAYQLTPAELLDGN